MSAPPLVADQPIDVEATFGFASSLPVLGRPSQNSGNSYIKKNKQ